MKRRVQVVLTLMPGAEAWVRVEHATGWFKLPAGAAIEELMTGATEGWSAHAARYRRGVTMVHMTMDSFVELKARADRAGPDVP